MTVGYVRISDDREGERLGVIRQREDITKKADDLGWPEVTEFYEDNDTTADPKKKPRPAFDRLLADMAAGKATHVLCYDQDRLVRDPRQLEDLVDVVEAGKVKLTSVNGDIDLLTDNGRLMARVKGAFAKAELEKLRRRVQRKEIQRAEQGLKKQGRFRTFGYNRDMTHHETEAPVVREVFDRKAKGESLTSIATDLRERGLTTTGGGVLDASALAKVIRRRDYIGEIALNGEVVGKAAFEPIVDRPVWELANSEAEKKNNRGNNARVSLLAGFLVCGTCLTKMKSGRAKEGPRYRCPGSAQVPGSCGSCSIAGEKTDVALFNATWRKEQDEVWNTYGTVAKPSEEPVRDFKAEIAALEAEIEQTHALRAEGTLALVDAVTIINDLRSKIAAVQREEAAAVSTDMGVLQLMFDWDEWSLSQQRLWIEQYVAFAVVTKADPSLPKKGFKQERITVHYKDGEVYQLPSLKTVYGPDGQERQGRTCEVEGCDNAYEAKGMCAKHYRAHRRAVAKGASA